MGRRSSALIVVLVFAVLFSLLYGAATYTPDVVPQPRITQEQAIEMVRQDLEANGLGPIRGIMAFRDIDDFENRGYISYSEFQDGEYRVPLAYSNAGGSAVTIWSEDSFGGDDGIVQDCSTSPDAFVCIVSCFSEGQLFWIIDMSSEYYAVDAVSGEIIFSQSRQQQMIQNNSEVAKCFRV